MSYYFRRVFSTPSLDAFEGRPCYRIACEISEAVAVTTKVFLHKRVPLEPGSEELVEEFVAICSPFDLTLFPADEPDGVTDPPFYRKASFDIPLPSVSAAAEVMTSVDAQLTLLCQLLSQLDVMAEVSDVWLPTSPPTTTPE